MTPTFENRQHNKVVQYWEHEGNKAVRMGRWKLVCRYPGGWELYDMTNDRSELHNLAADIPGLVDELSELYDKWAQRCDVMPWEKLQALRKARAGAIRPDDRRAVI